MRFLSCVGATLLACTLLLPGAGRAQAALGAPAVAAAAQRDMPLMLVLAKDAEAPDSVATLNMWLGLIPGEIFGKWQNAPVLLIPAALNAPFTMSLAAMERTLAPRALAARASFVKHGLTVAPKETRFLRVAAMVYDTKTEEFAMGGGFVDAAGRMVFLMYFDRACSLKGVTMTDDESSNIDLIIPAAGFFWVRYQQLNETRSRVRNSVSDATEYRAQ